VPNRFRRRTCIVSRAERTVDASIALFVRFGDSAGIDELMSMLAYDRARGLRVLVCRAPF